MTVGAHPIVLIDISGLRADHLGLYGYERETSPNLDALAREAVVFDWAFSPSALTGPAQASILTGTYPPANGVLSDGTTLAAEPVTLAEALRDRGYETAAFVDGGYLTKGFGLDQGFDVYDDSAGGGLAEVVPKALAWLEEHRGKKVFLMVHSSEALAPYEPSTAERGRFLEGIEQPEGFEPTRRALQQLVESDSGRTEGGDPAVAAKLRYAEALYDAELHQLDAGIGKLLEGLDRLGLRSEATVALVSDHGQAFGEHQDVLNASVYAPVSRVPLIVRLPNGAAAGRSDNPVDTIDLLPTLLELARVEIPEAVQGASLLGQLRDQGTPPYLAFSDSAERNGDLAVAMGGYHLVRSRQEMQAAALEAAVEGGEGATPAAADAAPPRLFYLPDDPLELHDLAPSEPDRVAVLERRLDDWQESVVATSLSEDSEGAKTLEELRNLGYVH